MTGVRLQPLDTWFFRDGTPFTADSAPQEDVRSLFPPHPPTVAGALRAALALSRGWSGRGGWSREIAGVLGDGPENPGVLSFDGPFVMRKPDDEPLFRAPRHLLGVADPDGWKPSAYFRPGDPIACDLGDATRLPEAPAERSGDWTTRKAGDRHWLTAAGMNAVLRGELPAVTDVVSSDSLWSEEPRIGLARDPNTRTAEEGFLYSTRHVRLARGVSLGVRIAGLPADWRPPIGRTLSFGGEGRMAEWREWNSALSLDKYMPTTTHGGQVTVIALSPLDLADDVCLGRRPLEALGGAVVVCACLDRPLRIGGWDSLARRPLPLRSVLSPGSVLFCEGAAPERVRNIITTGGLVRVGARRPLGFGLAALGAWPHNQEIAG